MMLEVWDADAPCIINEGRDATFPNRAIWTSFTVEPTPFEYAEDVGLDYHREGNSQCIYSKTKQRNPASRSVDVPLRTEHGMRSVIVTRRYFRTVTSPGRVWVEESDHPGSALHSLNEHPPFLRIQLPPDRDAVLHRQGVGRRLRDGRPDPGGRRRGSG